MNESFLQEVRWIIYATLKALKKRHYGCQQILKKKKDTNHLIFHCRKIGKEQAKPKASRGKEILKIKMEINRE